MRADAGWRLLAWGLALAGLVALAVTRLELSYDLGLFLPAPQTDAQRVLVERLGESPGSRYVLIAVEDDVTDVRRLIEKLEQSPGIERVLSDLTPLPGAPPEPLWSHRYLLADMDWSTEGLRETLLLRLGDLTLASDPALEVLVARDPALVSLELLERLLAPTGAPWLLEDGRRVLVAETTAAAFQLEGQAAAVAGIQQAIDAVFGADAYRLVSGAGPLGVELRETIQREATWRSLWASLAIAAVLLLVYRQPSILLLAALPLATGVAAGTAAVALVFGQVHGITLAFGFTLLGIAIDYPLHYLSRARHETPGAAISSTWPTLRLSAASTGLAYLALLFGGAQGMSQLGLFSAAGIAGALVTTRFLLPWLVPGPPADAPAIDERPPRLRFTTLAATALAALAVTGLARDGDWWSSDLSALSPIPAERLAQEGRLREATGAPNIRYQVVLRDTELQRALIASQSVHTTLASATEDGLIEGFHDLSPMLAPETEQRRRMAAIPDREELARRLDDSVADLPFSVAAFADFTGDAQASRALPPLTPEAFRDTPLEAALGQHLYRVDDGAWTVLATLRGEPDTAGLAARLAATTDAALVDLRAASSALVTDYRERVLQVLGGVVVLISVLLTWRLQPRRAAWSLGSMLAALLLAAALLRSLGGPLDLYHLVGLLLVAGIGLDYALFLGKPERGGTQHAVFACMASTVAAFGVLAASSIPALHSLGSAVALGSFLSFGVAWAGSRDA